MRRRLSTFFLVVLVGSSLFASASNASERIIGGTTVDATTVPWTVALLHAGTADGYQAQFCGGTLVNPGWVLTAAHCVKGTAASAVDVAWGISDLRAITAGDRHAISQIIVHPQYSAAMSTSDIALLRLTTPVPGAATLAMNRDPGFPALNQQLDTYGWGNTMYPGTAYPNLLQGVILGDLGGPSPTGSCGSYGGVYLGDHMVCAGVLAGGKDACQGDSGGPIVGTNGSSQRVLVGATSFGNGCALVNYPGLWSRVSSYADWVDQQINASVTPKVFVGDSTVVESDTGNRIASFTVTISPAPTAPMTVSYATATASATSGTDFVAKSGTLNFSAGQITKPIAVPVKADANPEGLETFSVHLTGSAGADAPTISRGTGTGTIVDDDATAGNQLTIGDGTAVEGDNGTGTVTIKALVSLTTAPGVPFTVPYTTVVGGAGPYDFGIKSGTLSFSSSAQTKTIAITIKREWIPEGDEVFAITLGTPTTTAVTVTRGGSFLTILNDD